MSDRFDLEQAILKSWEIVDDLKHYMNCKQKLSEEQKDDFIKGLIVKYDTKFDYTFNLFEECVANGQVK